MGFVIGARCVGVGARDRWVAVKRVAVISDWQAFGW
nr:MAG TPA: hypothetical protein [Caudoviricetes sp.]